jgi:hypothetical protein
MPHLATLKREADAEIARMSLWAWEAKAASSSAGAYWHRVELGLAGNGGCEIAVARYRGVMPNATENALPTTACPSRQATKLGGFLS